MAKPDTVIVLVKDRVIVIEIKYFNRFRPVQNNQGNRRNAENLALWDLANCI